MTAILIGPLFDGRADSITHRACQEAQHAVANETTRLVKLHGQVRFRYEHSAPTGKWTRSIHDEPRGDLDVVTDSGIVYGNWLNGTGSRNATTRFKGYFMWRKAMQDMERSGAMAIAVPIIEKAVGVINA